MQLSSNIMKKENYYFAVLFSMFLYLGYWFEQVGVFNTITFVLPQISGILPIIYLSAIVWLIFPLFIVIFHFFQVVLLSDIKDKKPFSAERIVKLTGFLLLIFFMTIPQLASKMFITLKASLICYLIDISLMVLLAEYLKRSFKIEYEKGVFLKNNQIEIMPTITMCWIFLLGGTGIGKYVQQNISVSIPGQSKSVVYLGALSDKYILRDRDDILIVDEVRLKGDTVVK